MFPMDTIECAREMKRALNCHGVGTYTHSKVVRQFREHKAHFIECRDGFEPGLRERDAEMSAGLDGIPGSSRASLPRAQCTASRAVCTGPAPDDRHMHHVGVGVCAEAGQVRIPDIVPIAREWGGGR